MTNSPRFWTDADNSLLKSLAGKLQVIDIAALLGRSVGATVVQASKLKISLRVRAYVRHTVNSSLEPGPSGIDLHK